MPEPLPKEMFASKGISLYGVAPVPEKERWLPCRKARELQGVALSSVICFAVPYYTGPLEGRNLSRYTCLRDYHQVVGEILAELCGELEKRFPSESFFPFCDDSPFPEKQLALECGLGCLGDNTLLLTRDYGSYVFLATIATTKELDFTLSPLRECLHCGRCAAVCPGGALSVTETGPRLDRSRCASSLTQQKKSLAPEQEKIVEKAGLAWGCDWCQEVCPLNASPSVTPIKAFLEDQQPVLTRENLQVLRQSRAFGYRPPEVLLRNLEILEKQEK